ncbi:MAG: peptidylprolyl isomerase [Chthoniobacterales bacterium]
MKYRYLPCLLALTAVTLTGCDKKTENSTPATDSEQATAAPEVTEVAEVAEITETPTTSDTADTTDMGDASTNTPEVVEEETVVIDATQAAAPDAAASAFEALPDPVATVNGKPVSKADFVNSLSEVFGSMGLDPSMIPPAQQGMLFSQFLKDLINDKLIESASAEVEVTDADVNAEIEKIRSQYPDPTQFEQELTAAGQSLDSIKDRLKTMLRQRKWVESQTKDVTVSDEEISEYYANNSAQFEQPELVRASHILFLADENADAETDAASKKKATDAIARSKKGEDFDELVVELSEEPGAAERKGDLNFFPKDRMVPEFADAAFGMEVDTISEEPVRTRFGWHVIKVTDKKDSRTVPLDEVKENIKEFITEEKTQKEVETIVETLRSKSDVETFLPEPTAPAAPEAAPAQN